MNQKNNDPIEAWIRALREESGPVGSDDFCDRIENKTALPLTASSILLGLAALVAAALVGFFRLELITHLLLSS